MKVKGEQSQHHEETETMKPYRQMHAPPFGSATPAPRWSLTDRGAALAILSLPFALAALAFLLAVITTTMGEMAQGTLRFYLAAFSYSYLMACLMCLPAYAIGYGWYWWKTKGGDADLGKPLLWMPLIAAAFVWFPAVLFPQLTGTGRVQVFLLLAGASLVVGYLWVAVVRFILRVWRKV